MKSGGWFFYNRIPSHRGTFHFYIGRTETSLCGHANYNYEKLVTEKKIDDHKCPLCERQKKSFDIDGLTSKERIEHDDNRIKSYQIPQSETANPKITMPENPMFWVNAVCSEPKCEETGVFPTSNPLHPKHQEHYCYKHNGIGKR